MKITHNITLILIAMTLFCCHNESDRDVVQLTNKPNIIYIYADDLGYGELGCYGQEKIKTPNLDQMASEGIRFTQHYTSTPVCAPARCMLMTGRHAGHSYIRGNYALGGGYDYDEGGNMPLPEGAYTIGHMMQEAGYVTGAIGKWGLGSYGTTGEPYKQGFDYFYGFLGQRQPHSYYPTHLRENNSWDTLNNTLIRSGKIDVNATDEDFDKFEGNDYAGDKLTEKALKFIQGNKDKNFFLYLPYIIPHAALQIPSDSEAYKMYKDNQWDSVAYYGQNGYTPHRQPRAAYAAMITQLDMYVGQIMDLLKDLKLDENTIVMFSSDNGTTFNGGVDAKFFNSTHGLRGLKMDLYEGGIREPFIVRWPGVIPPDQVTDHISAQYDIMATIADIIDAEIPENDGISVLPSLMGKENDQVNHEFIYFEYPEKRGQVAIRIGDWKGIMVDMKTNSNAQWELYNLKNDISERSDLADQNPNMIAKMDSILKEEHTIAHVNGWEFIDPRYNTKR